MATSPFSPPLFLSLCFAFFLLASASSESDFLLTFKSSVEDPNDSLSTWSSTSATHFCNWTGVLCQSSLSPFSVTSINLQSFNLSGEISSSVCQLLNLAHLNLADNQFNQPIPLHLSMCTSLETLNLSNNLIWGTIPDQISGFLSLRVLDLSMNHVEGKIPSSVGLLKNLQVLNLGSNLLSGNVDRVFENLTELVAVNFSHNLYLVSEIPSDIGKLEKLEQLLLQNSGFHGSIPDSLVDLQNLMILDLSQNNLSGRLPPTLGSALSELKHFDVSQNKLFGSFPDGICRRKGLINLSLHTNSFSGSIPTSITECSDLERFQVQNNAFSGDVPNGLWSLPKIKLIRAENNRLSGELPETISMATQLEQIQLDNNSLSSKIPDGVGLLKSLYRFSASLNHFHGELPLNFCNSPVMSIINLSHNSLSGWIPDPTNCRRLVSLSLADNSFSGYIPSSLSDLPVLTYLDLSDNNLTGPIPQGLQNLKLALFNVSFNQLSGEVPNALISGLPASFLQGNPELCGAGLENPCSEGPLKRHSTGFTTMVFALISIAMVLGVVIVLAAFIAYNRSNKRKSQGGHIRSVFFYPLRLNELDLTIGIDEKSARGSGGAFGRVYVLSLRSGDLVVVKKLVNFGSPSTKALKVEIKNLAKIRHKNITKILGFCHSDESLFLIYEYLQNGSLGDLICRGGFCLDWNVRLRIAIGVAQGLAYLHKDYVPHLLHRNLKSSNILLDVDYVPKLTDFALDRVLGESAFQATLDSESSCSCYIAPECRYSKRATEQIDVYSFGVVLLELVSGRQAERSESKDSLDVVQWVRRRANIMNGALQIIDRKIPVLFHSGVEEALNIALACTSVMPEKRPTMLEVVKALQSLVPMTNESEENSLVSEENPI